MELKDFYEYCKMLDIKKVDPKDSKFIDFAKKINVTPKQCLSVYGIFHKLANATKDSEEWEYCLQNNELPALKLSEVEMELVKGGILPFVIGAVKVIGYAAAAWGAGEFLYGVYRGYTGRP